MKKRNLKNKKEIPVQIINNTIELDATSLGNEKNHNEEHIILPIVQHEYTKLDVNKDFIDNKIVLNDTDSDIKIFNSILNGALFSIYNLCAYILNHLIIPLLEIFTNSLSKVFINIFTIILHTFILSLCSIIFISPYYIFFILNNFLYIIGIFNVKKVNILALILTHKKITISYIRKICIYYFKLLIRFYYA